MSGLLVKSTLIMRENLEELNRRGLAHIPVLLGGAALTRTYVERDLREVYEGRLFYGKDAFEGLRTMDRLVELSKSGEDDPEFGRPSAGGTSGPEERAAQQAAPRRATGARPCRPGRPRWPPTTRSSRRRSSGSRVAKGIPIDDIAGYLNETALFRNQWGFRPERTGEDDADVQGAGAAPAARPAGRGQGRAAARAPGGLRALRGQRRGRRPRHLEGRDPHRRSGCASASPARPRTRGCASPTSSARSTPASRTGPASMS